MAHPTNNCNTQHHPLPKKTKPPTHTELLQMETSSNIAECYLALLSEILTPSDGINDSAPGLERFSQYSRQAIGLMIDDIFTALRHYSTLIEYAHDTTKQNERVELVS